MASTITGTATAIANFTQTEVLDLGSPVFQVNRQLGVVFTAGTGANQVDRMFADARTLAAGANEDIDLGAQLDALRASLTFARVKVLQIKNTGLAPIKVQPGAANGWATAFADDLFIRPGGHIQLAAPDATAYAVTVSTDVLNITNLDGAVAAAYEIIIVGVAT